MDKLIIKTAPPYPIYFRHSYDDLGAAFREAGIQDRKICIVTDSNVSPLYLDAVKAGLGSASAFIFKAGEASKNIRTLEDMYKCFLDNKLDRRSVVVALGGGVTGDLAGFAAATFMRGITFVQLPTSLLAQVDAGVGGKTAIDFEGVKNLIGAFYQPRLVYMNLSALNTLPTEEFISGMGEVVKHGLISDKGYYEFLQSNRVAIQNLDPEAMLEVVAGSCRIKAAVVEEDERESGLREILNFGHCVGHAVESLSDYSLPHGQCVAIGMCAALRMSGISKSDQEQAQDLMEFFKLPTSASDYKPEEIISTMYKDKKTLNDKLRVVLLKKIGEAYTDDGVTNDRILSTLK